MDPIEPVRFEDGRPMLLAGIRRQHSYSGAARSIPEQWAEFRAQGALPGRRGSTAYGVMCSASPEEQTFEYMCAMEVDSFDALPPGTGRMRVPPQHYAVFEHAGHVSTVQRTWEAAWSEWLPRSGYSMVNGPEFEAYGERFDPATGLGGLEVWIAIEKAEPPR